MNLFLMKVDWFEDTISCSLPASLLAKIFVTNFVKLCTKLMGL
jgi:hypothetical protein